MLKYIELLIELETRPVSNAVFKLRIASSTVQRGTKPSSFFAGCTDIILHSFADGPGMCLQIPSITFVINEIQQSSCNFSVCFLRWNSLFWISFSKSILLSVHCPSSFFFLSIIATQTLFVDGVAALVEDKIVLKTFQRFIINHSARINFFCCHFEEKMET